MSTLTKRQLEYQDYLRSAHWQEVRLRALEYAGYHCQACNAKGLLDVHHRTYERVGSELPADLIVLCRRCHDLFHGNGAPRKQKQKPRKRKKTGIVADVRRQLAKGNGRNDKRATALERENERLHRLQVGNRRGRQVVREQRLSPNLVGWCEVCGRQCVWRTADGQVVHPGCWDRWIAGERRVV